MVEIGRNFANKMWNAGRFLLMNAQNIPLNLSLKINTSTSLTGGYFRASIKPSGNFSMPSTGLRLMLHQK
jgi:autotransporter translocation and assembly factor TamB